jgi:hypothetical protein
LPSRQSGSLAVVDDLRRFRHEAEAIADLDDSHIIPICEICQEKDQGTVGMNVRSTNSPLT